MKYLLFTLLVTSVCYAGVNSYTFFTDSPASTTSTNECDRTRLASGTVAAIAIDTETNVTFRVIAEDGAGLSLAGDRVLVDWTAVTYAGLSVTVTNGVLLGNDRVNVQFTASSNTSQKVRVQLTTTD